MPAPRAVHMPPPPPVIELPNGDRYHLHPRTADLEGYLAPEHAPRLGAGIEPVQVRVTRGHSGYTVSLAPHELEELLKDARLEIERLADRPPIPEAPIDPTRGRGLRDPEAHRLGPNVEYPPDPGHRGTHRSRRKP